MNTYEEIKAQSGAIMASLPDDDLSFEEFDEMPYFEYGPYSFIQITLNYLPEISIDRMSSIIKNSIDYIIHSNLVGSKICETIEDIRSMKFHHSFPTYPEFNLSHLKIQLYSDILFNNDFTQCKFIIRMETPPESIFPNTSMPFVSYLYPVIYYEISCLVKKVFSIVAFDD